MKKTLNRILLGLVLITFATPGFAENRSGTFNLSPFIGGYVLDKDQAEKDGVMFGLRGGYNFTRNLGAEVMFGYSPAETKRGSRDTDMYRYGVDLLYHFMPDSIFVPFVAIGGGGTSFNAPDNSSAQNHFAGLFSYGAGFKYFVTDNIALRGDVRHILLHHDTGDQNLEYSAGLTFQLGGKAKPASALVAAQAEKPAPPPVDSDADGVPDYLDKCPGTPAGIAVDKDGCPPVAEKVVIPASEPKVAEMVKAAVTEPEIAVPVLVGVHFSFNQSSLTPEAKRILKKDILLLKENPGIKIRVAGYTSASGTEEYNQKLSERRAKAVQKFLINEGLIARDRLSTVGYGEAHPAVHEADPMDLYSEAAKANMRVLFEIIVQ